ncbi:PilN domain-containing protein [Hyphomicrobium facile]|uniref:Fimbrial assembly protein (PilN) n=1 Tax=Hyphomicrobium facile TaxID=51670 RepID=A0A1I7NQW2_9HYPH|nr:PilN domain-containing protein [Hyphomicrobium facile]SFV36982.1 Fimbrial assembly protein (PilN) [Hyphomicrobium facile]
MLASISDPFSRFFTWWGAELAGIVSASPAAASDNPNIYTVVVLQPAGYRLIEPRRHRTTSTNSSDEAPLALPELLSLLAGIVRANPSATVGIRLPHRACFVRNVTLPGAAARDFATLLSLDLERSTPFKQNDVYTAYTVDQSQSGGWKQSVRQYIIKKTLVDALRSDIEALGLKVTAVACSNEAGSIVPINFLEEPSRSAGARIKLLIGLAGLALLLAAAGAYIDIARHQAALAELQSETASLKVEAKSVRDMTTKYRSTASAIASFNQLRRESVSRVAILEELTRLLPDSAWVTDIKISGVTVDISGLAASASALVPILEKSPLFVDATSTSALTFDPLQDKERFGIRVRLRNVPEDVEKTGEEAQ